MTARNRATLLTAAIALGGALALSPALAAEQTGVVRPGEVTWTAAPPVLPPGAQIAVIAGDLDEREPFVFRLRLPADYEIPPHRHPVAEMVTVLSGTLHFGTGARLDRERSEALPAGGFMRIPAGEEHFAWTTAETVIQVHGTGPFGITRVGDGHAHDHARQAAR